MSNEAQVRASLSIRKGKIDYASKPTTFRATVTGTKGPVPGAFTVTVAGTDVDLSQLTTPGLCKIQNLDATSFVEYGIWDGSSFYPLGEVLPGEVFILRLSRNLNEEYGTGTGTTGAAANTLRFKANPTSCTVVVEAFEK